MDNKNFLKDVYEDFFGIEKMKEQNEKLKQELGLTEDYPAIEMEEAKDVTNNVGARCTVPIGPYQGRQG